MSRMRYLQDEAKYPQIPIVGARPVGSVGASPIVGASPVGLVGAFPIVGAGERRKVRLG